MGSANSGRERLTGATIELLGAPHLDTLDAPKTFRPTAVTLLLRRSRNRRRHRAFAWSVPQGRSMRDPFLARTARLHSRYALSRTWNRCPHQIAARRCGFASEL